jgi:thiamine pyrophosphokinase
MVLLKLISGGSINMSGENEQLSFGEGHIALIIANGRINNYHHIMRILKKEYGYTEDIPVFAVDGGIKHCINMHVYPDLIIGDMDSVNIKLMEKLSSTKKEMKFVNASTDKDESDTQLAVDYLIKQNFKKIIIVGALGDRIDHTFANLVLLASPHYEDAVVRIIDEHNEISVLKKSSNINGGKGKRISLFSLSPYTHFISTEGLKYSLKDERLLFSPVRGLSNEFTEDTASIKIKKGILLIVREI